VAIKAVLFDFGETLVQDAKPVEKTLPRAILSSYEALRRNGLNLQYEQYKELSGSAFQRHWKLGLERNRPVLDLVVYQEIVDSLFPSRSRVWSNRVSAQTNDAFWGVITRNYVMNRHARLALAKLKAMKLRMAVISNLSNPQAVSATLERLRLAEYFARTFVSSEVGTAKPDPRIFEMCLASIKTPPGHAVFVGDSPSSDVVGAKKAGMRAILLANDTPPGQNHQTDTEPDFVVHDLLEVVGIVSSLA